MDKPEIIMRTQAGLGVAGIIIFFAVIHVRPEDAVSAAAVYAVYMFLDLMVGYTLLHREIRSTLMNVNETIQGLLDETPVRRFSEESESLLGKFQFQIARLYRILTAHKEQEQKMREDLSGLVADLVHQINTPLANIEMYVDFLMQEDLDEVTKKKFLNNVKSQTEKLGWFGEGFDKVARMETDIISLKPEYAKVLPTVLSAIDEASLKAQMKGNEICLEGDMEIAAYHDRKWTAEAFFNLLDNAVKYGTEGTKIYVRLSAYQMYVRIDVDNEGPVIPLKEQAKVFGRFYRGSSAVMVQEGVGLGLYLVRQIIGGEGGYVLLENWQEKGSRFSVFLRKQEADDENTDN